MSRSSNPFVDSLARARFIHKNTDLGRGRIDKLEDVVSHLIICLEEMQKNAKKLVV